MHVVVFLITFSSFNFGAAPASFQPAVASPITTKDVLGNVSFGKIKNPTFTFPGKLLNSPVIFVKDQHCH